MRTNGLGWHRNITIPVTTADIPLYNLQGYVCRVSFRETTGTASAVFNIYDGSGTTGQLIACFQLPAGQSANFRYNPYDLPFDGGLYLNMVSGSIQGAVTIQTPAKNESIGLPVVLVNPEVLSLTVTPSY